MNSKRKFMKLGLLLALVIMLSIMSVGMASAAVGFSTDFRLPGTGSQAINYSGSGSTGWGDVGYIVNADGNAALNTVYTTSPTYYLIGSNFGFTEAMIPSGAVITGIEVVIGRADSPYGVDDEFAGIQDLTVKLVNAAGNIVGENKAQTDMDWPEIVGYTVEAGDFIEATYGGPGDLWELGSWSASDILDPDFGVALSAINTVSNLSSAWVDYMKIKVYYTVEGVATPTLEVTNSPVTYNGSPQDAAVSGSVDGVVSDVKYDGSSVVPADAGTYAVTADFTPDDTANYATLNDASAGSFTIDKATPTLEVTNSPVTYNGSPQAAAVSGSVPGEVGDILYDESPVIPTSAGTYAVTADFAPTDSTNYASLNDASAGSFTIGKATPTLEVTNSPVTYNGSPQAAAVSGSVDGVVSDVKYDGSSVVPADAGTYAVTADFTPSYTANYTSLSDASAGSFIINPLIMTYAVTVTVAEDSALGGWADGEGYFEEGDLVTVNAYVNEGYRFVNWTENDTQVSTNATYQFAMGTADCTLVAHFELIPIYSVSVSANPTEGGSVSGAGTFAEGARVTVTAIANEGYSFVNWTEGTTVVSTRATYRFNMGTAARNLVANFMAVGPSWPSEVRLSATAVTSTSVTLTLSQPVPGAEAYVVSYGGEPDVFNAGDGTTLLIDGLSRSTPYTFTVQARYAGGVETTDGPSKKVKTKR
jgi:hypothetical protein